MDLMSQLPVLKTQAPSGTAKQSKAEPDEVEAAEVVSFPTLLQDSKNELEAVGKKPSSTKHGTQDTPPKTQPHASAGLLNPGAVFEGLSPLLSSVGANFAAISNSPVEGTVEGAIELALESVVEGASEVKLEAPIAAEILNSEISSPDKSEASPVSITSQDLPEIQTMTAAEISNVIEKEIASLTENPLKVSAPGEQTVAVPVSSPSEEQLSPDVKPLSPELKTIEGKGQNANLNNDALALGDKEIPKTKPQETQQALPELETMKVEVVKEAATPEQNSSPVVENPILARQTSAELDMLSVQANAQKNYEQAPVTADPQTVAQATLADLDLESGTSGSKEQTEQGLSKILSSLAEKTSPVKQKIQSQVLSRVVEHLQEEMGKEKLTIRLNPEKLGQIEVMFQAQGDQLNITMTSNTKEAEHAIQEGTKELSDSIADRSQRWNFVEIRVENRSSDQQNKQDARQDERREKQNKGEHQQQEGHRSHGDHNQETGASEWAAFHLGG